MAVVTNIEADHLDFFGSAEAYARGVRRVRRAAAARRRAGGLRRRSGCRGTGRARRPPVGVRVLRYGSGDDPNLAGALLNWEQQGTGERGDGPAGRRVASARACALRCPAGTWRSTRLGALLAAMEAGADVSSRCSTGWPGSKACDAVSSRSARRRACGSSTTTRTIRPRCARHSRPLRARGGRGPLDRGVPAAPVLADQDLRAGVRAGAERRRRGLRARRVRGAGTTDGRGERRQRRRARQRAGALRAGLLGGRRAGGRGGATRRRRRDDGRGRRHAAGTGDPDGAAGRGPVGDAPVRRARATSRGAMSACRRAERRDEPSRREPADAGAGADEPRYRPKPRQKPKTEPTSKGPRRRARREREERRAAQARATAIEEARREAKSRVDGPARPIRPNPLRAG